MIILASTSPYRKKLLAQLGVEFRCQSPGVDESTIKTQISSPSQCAQTLARLKAEAISERSAEDVVIGADQVCSCQGQIFSRPGNRENAIAQLEQLAGKTHQLFTAVCLIMPQRRVEFINTATLTMRPLSLDEICTYVDLDRPYFCAGSYMIEQRGMSLFSKIDTTDFTSIIGLPLQELAQHLGLKTHT